MALPGWRGWALAAAAFCGVVAFVVWRWQGPAAPPRAPEGPRGPLQMSVLFTSGLGGRTADLARRASLVDRERVRQAPFVQVDAGDIVGPGAGEDRLVGARLMLLAYARMGVDAITVGDNELSLGLEPFEELTRAIGVPVVAANLVKTQGERVFPASRLVSAGTLRVGIFGIVDLPVRQAWPGSNDAFRFTDAVAGVREQAQSLRAQGAQVVVGLFQVAGGGARAREIVLGAGGGVDVVVLGSAGRASGADGTVPLVVSSGAGGTVVGRIDVYAQGPRRSLEPQFLPTAGVPEQIAVGLLVRLGPGLALEPAARDAGPPALGWREHWTYASVEACAFCHTQQVAQWKTTAHAHALETLREARRERAAACLGCHTTGFLQPGGTEVVDTAISEFPDVGCESCHGPSASHVASVDKKKGTSRKVDQVVCFGCHAPDQSLEPFDVAGAWKRILGPGHGEAAL